MQSSPQASTLDEVAATAPPEPDWDEVWLPSWVNDAAAPPEPPADAELSEPRLGPETEAELAADLQAVDRLAAQLLTEAAAAFEASVAAWAHGAAAEPSADESSVDDPFVDEPSADDRPDEPSAAQQSAPATAEADPPAPRVVSPPVSHRRPRIWLASWGALLVAGVVIGLLLSSGSSGHPALSASAQDRSDVVTYAQDPTAAGDAAVAAVITAAGTPASVVPPVPEQGQPVPVVHRAVVPAQRVAAVATVAVAPTAPGATSAAAVLTPSGGSAPTSDPASESSGATESTSSVSPSPSCGPASPSATATPTETTQAAETSAAGSSSPSAVAPALACAR